MNVERLTEEYLKQLDHQKKLEKVVGELKTMLQTAIKKEGEPDEKGHTWLPAGSYLLKIQKSQGAPKLSVEAATGWAKGKGIWDKVKETVEVLDEDKLMAYMYDHQDEEGLEEEFKELYITPDPVYSFIKPIEQTEIEY